MSYEFSRQPRFLPDMPRGEIDVPNPPMINEKPEISWFGILLPPIVMLIITVLIAMTSQSIYLLISVATTVMTLIGSLTGATSQIRKYKLKKKEREEKYLQFITDVRSDLSIAREQQVKAMNEMSPDPAECVQRISRRDNKLWEKRLHIMIFWLCGSGWEVYPWNCTSNTPNRRSSLKQTRC